MGLQLQHHKQHYPQKKQFIIQKVNRLNNTKMNFKKLNKQNVKENMEAKVGSINHLLIGLKMIIEYLLKM